MDFSIIIDHPDNKEIISKIITGTNIKDICQWLKLKYSDKNQKHLQINQKILQEFADKHVDLENQLKKDIAIVQNSGGSLTTNPKIANSLLNNKTYQERLIELASKKLEEVNDNIQERINVKNLISKLVLTCEARMEQIFDKIQQNPTDMRGDYVLIKYFETLFMAMEKFDKIVNAAPDQIVQHNFQIEIADQHVLIFQEAIRETLAQIDTESAILFMEIFTEKLNTIKYPKKNINNELKSKVLEEIIPQLEN